MKSEKEQLAETIVQLVYKAIETESGYEEGDETQLKPETEIYMDKVMQNLSKLLLLK